jgi:hypothetical protein
MPKINASTLPKDPIGILPDGSLNVVKAGDPAFRPSVVDDEGKVVEVDDDKLEDRNLVFDTHWTATAT